MKSKFAQYIKTKSGSIPKNKFDLIPKSKFDLIPKSKFDLILKKILLLFLIFLAYSTTNARDIAVFSYQQLEPLLNRQNDTTYVINFWATWCKPCVEELHYFEKVSIKHKIDKVKVILVSLDFASKIEKSLKPFLKKRNIQSEVILLDDPNSHVWIDKISSDWSGAIPATLIYKNRQRKFYERSFTFDELEKEIHLFTK